VAPLSVAYRKMGTLEFSRFAAYCDSALSNNRLLKVPKLLPSEIWSGWSAETYSGKVACRWLAIRNTGGVHPQQRNKQWMPASQPPSPAINQLIFTLGKSLWVRAQYEL
jgi:hypothetical protein